MTGDKKKKTDPVASKVANKAVKKTVSKAADKTTGKVANKVAIAVASKAVGKAVDKTAGKDTKKAVGKTAGKTILKTAGKTTGKAVGKAVGFAVSKAVDKTVGKTAGKPLSKTAGAVSKGEIQKHPVPIIDWQEFLEKMESSLQGQKSGIVDTLIASSNDFKEIVEGMDPKDFADIASDDIDRKMIEALGSQELKRLRMIDSALARIKQGKYGNCIKCDKRIPTERLEAIPYALMCIECKSEEERRNR